MFFLKPVEHLRNVIFIDIKYMIEQLYKKKKAAL